MSGIDKEFQDKAKTEDKPVFEMPREGKFAIWGSGGFTGRSGPGFSVELSALDDAQITTATQLIEDFLATDFSKFPRGMDVPSHHVQVGDKHFELYPTMLPRFDNEYCPASIRNLYGFIQDPANFAPVEDVAPSDGFSFDFD